MTDAPKYPYIIDLASQDHDKLDGAKLKADGCVGIIARAEIGMVNDADFAKHKAVAIGAGLRWGGYFAPRWDEPIEPQMQRFLAALGKRTKGTFTPWIDVEEGPRNFDHQAHSVVLAKWSISLDMMIAWGGDAGTYSSARVLREGLNNPDLSAIIPKTKWWLTPYTGYHTPPPTPPGVPADGWTLHQFAGDSDKVPGVTGRVDLSRFNPALGDMDAYFDADVAPAAQVGA